MSENLIRIIIKESIDANGNVNIATMQRKWRVAQIDKRYKLFFLAATCPCRSAIIQFRGQKWFFDVDVSGEISLARCTR